MLFIRWIKNREGRLVCAWGDKKEMGAFPTHALSGGKSLLAEIESKEDEYAPCAGSSRRDYPALVWVSPKRYGKSPSLQQSELPIGVCLVDRIQNEICNIASILHMYYSGMLNSKAVCAMLNRVGYGKTFMTQQALIGMLSGFCCCFSHVAMAEPTEVQGTIFSNNVAIAAEPAAQVSTVAPVAPEAWGMYGQFTGVSQSHSGFTSPYQGTNSLSPNSSNASTTDLTLFAGMRVWGGEIWINPEIDQGFGLSNTLGMAGFPSGEAYKVGANSPYLRLPRLFYRRVFNLGGEEQTLAPAANQLGRTQSADNVILTLGKFSVTDVFDSNAYAHDPRSDFMNWSIVDAGAFDYAADAWGFAKGASVEWTQSWWTLRGGFFDLSQIPNTTVLDQTFAQHEWVIELEERHQLWEHPGKVKLLGFINQGKMGSYVDALQLAQQTGNPPDISLVRRGSSQSGFAINLEQELASDMGGFARASMNEGNKEAFEFTEINQSVSAGLSLRGDRWGRHDDTFGFAAVANGLSSAARNYFAAGGMGILIGDGQLPHYGSEKIMETYYSYSVPAVEHLMLTLNYQYVVNPGYNQDRGPVNIFGVRVHKEF